jgi:hypothetical protein
MSDLADFLYARITEDERAASAAEHAEPWPDAPAALAAHLARWAPARVLAECEAKRENVERHSAFSVPQQNSGGIATACLTCAGVDDSPTDWPCDTLRSIALPYSDHPDYLDEWRP